MDYFQSLRSADVRKDKGDSVLFRFVGGVGLGLGETRLIHQLCVQMGYPVHGENQIHTIGAYLSGDNRSILDNYPELKYFRDINFMLRLLMVPSNENIPKLKKWKSTDAELHWKYVLPKETNEEIETHGTFQVIGFENRILSWKEDSKRESQTNEIKMDKNVTNRGFLTRLFLGKNKKIGRAPQSLANPSHLAGTEILDEEDVLHVDTLPSFNGRLPAQHCEVLLQFLTVPYLRIPLVTKWFR